ncbi:MAG TPA: hypothetical protein DD490_21900 [Acidobacteria bacterium]|nr:hypothetical protein [Acidobacteriota bacterium]
MIGELSRHPAAGATEVESREVESRIDDYLHAAESGKTVVVTRNGSPVAALIPLMGEGSATAPEDDSPEKGLAGLAGGWDGSDELADLVMAALISSRRSSSD